MHYTWKLGQQHPALFMVEPLQIWMNTKTATERYSLVRNLDQIDCKQWNSLAGDHPLLRYEFLSALDQTGCAVPETGWAPHYLVMHRAQAMVGAMPLYLKSHSRGEYVFDYSWAHAFERHGLNYYPKLLSAVPFSPVPGPRILAQSHGDRVRLAHKAIEIATQNGVSSLHILFPSAEDELALREAGFLFRDNVQFHWFNDHYACFDDFLAAMSQQKRKKIKQDRRKVDAAGIQFRHIEGHDIDENILSFFYRCYFQTYMEHGNAPYLNQEFFRRLRDNMPNSMVIVVAEQHGHPIAAALNLRSERRLYGRYWGSIRYVAGLHFETCYIQGIIYCIENGLAVFEGGAQGEHKLSRGMLPVRTCSAHWIADQRYSDAIMDFLAAETPAITAYIDELHEHSPFKKRID